MPARANHEGVWTIDGVVVTAESVYSFTADKTAVAVYTEVVDITDRLFVDNRTSWGAHDGEVYLALLDMGVTNTVLKDDGSTSTNNYLNTAESVCATWHAHNKDVIAKNGVDIMEYILVNGVSARKLITDNVNGDQVVNNCKCWLSNPAASPVYVETTVDSGLLMKFLTQITGEDFVVTIKAGFRLTNSLGQIIIVTKDVDFVYSNGVCTRDYVLSFDGVEADDMVVTYGETIGELPAIPARDGFIAYWAIDGVEITANTVYTYAGSKVAVATYVKDTFNMYFEGTDAPVDSIVVKSGKVIDNLPAVPVKEGYFGYWTIDGVKLSTETVFNFGADVTAVACYVESTDITNRIFMEERAWGAHDGELYVALLDMAVTDGEGRNWFNTHDSVNSTWYATNNDIIEANAGYDIMKYILINGVSARELINANANGEKSQYDCNGDGVYGKHPETNESDCWLSNYLAYPVYVETTPGSGLIIRTLQTLAGDNWVITIKAGFTILDVDGNRVHVSKDIEFSKNSEGAIVRDYVLNFEGTEDVREITYGAPIGDLPEVPAKAGYTGVWTIDGEEIFAERQYHFYGDKTAVVAYTPIDYTITINRANGAVETLTFNDLTKAEVLASIDLTADSLFYAYSWQEALPVELELRDYALVEVATEQPACTRIISYSLTFGVDFAMNVYAEVIGDMPSMKFVMGEREVVVSGVLVDATANKYAFVLDAIKAHELAETFTATLFIGETVIDSVEYSVEAYLNKLAAKDALSDELKTLIADIIVYGQAAEAAAGMDGGIQSIEGLVPTEHVDLTEGDSTKTTSKDPDVSITKAFVEYDGNGNIVVLFRAADVSNVVVTVNGVEVDFNLLEDAVGVYKVVSGDIFVTNTKVKYTFKIFVDGTEVQRIVYNQQSYVYEVQNDGSVIGELMKAMYNLSNSAKTYIASEGV